jgi:hypothetical protein
MEIGGIDVFKEGTKLLHVGIPDAASDIIASKGPPRDKHTNESVTYSITVTSTGSSSGPFAHATIYYSLKETMT